MAEGGGEGNGLSPGGKVEGFNEMLSIKHFDLPEAICWSSCSGTETWGDDISKQRSQPAGMLDRIKGERSAPK